MADFQSRAGQREATRRAASGHFQAWEQRTKLVKSELEQERAASDVKTAKLRALRLAKEEADRDAARIAAENAPKTSTGKRSRPAG